MTAIVVILIFIILYYYFLFPFDSTAVEKYHGVLCLGSDYENPNHPLNVLNEAWKQVLNRNPFLTESIKLPFTFFGRKIHYPPETTTILLIVKLVAMYKQTDKKEELFNAIQDFHHEFINENLMISHKMLGENHQTDLNNLFTLFSNSFDFTGTEMVFIECY